MYANFMNFDFFFLYHLIIEESGIEFFLRNKVIRIIKGGYSNHSEL